MSALPSAVHADIVAKVEAVTGLTEAATPWSLDSFPGSAHDGGFLVIPTADAGGVWSGGGLSTVLSFEVYLPWRLTGAPNAAAQACMDKVHAVRAALTGVLSHGRATSGPVTYSTSSDGHTMVAVVPVDVNAFLTA